MAAEAAEKPSPRAAPLSIAALSDAELMTPVAEAWLSREGAAEEELARVLAAAKPPSADGAAAANAAAEETKELAASLDKLKLGDGGGAVTSRVRRLLGGYAFSREASEVAFAEGVSREDRRTVHEVAQSLGLESQSFGYGKQRRLFVHKPQLLVDVANRRWCDRLVARYYLGLEGPGVDAAALRPCAHVTDAERARRAERDGDHHHITLVSRPECEWLAQQPGPWHGKQPAELLSELVRRAAQTLRNDWRDLGVGRVVEANKFAKAGPPNWAVFRIVAWESANAFRRAIGLPPADFHITLGFARDDIHGVRKDLSTRLDDAAPAQPPQPPQG
jgi:hypothetical protein